MVGSKESATLSYADYKRTIWSRLVEFWREKLDKNPDSAWASARLAVCEARLRIGRNRRARLPGEQQS
jgi:hypothetical protein